MPVSNPDDKRNYLRIESPEFSLELEGDPNFILETYDNVRQDVLRRLIDLIRSGQQAPQQVQQSGHYQQVHPQQQRQPQQRAPMQRQGAANRTADIWTRPQEERSSGAWDAVSEHEKEIGYIWVYITHEIYNKVYVVDLNTFAASPLSRCFDGRRLRKIYIDREFQGVLGPLVGTGKTLWSELTKQGRERLSKVNE